MEVCQPAAQLLREVRTPVGVISVCGRARTGKSFILNQLLGSSAGFRLAHSHRPCTKGLWIWSHPIRRMGPDGLPYNLILLDSEGIDAYNQTAQDAVQLLSLAVLLSSMFVFNQMGPIDEAAIDRLGLVTEITKHIRVRATEGGAGAPEGISACSRELGHFTPTFLWLLRDFYLDLHDEGRTVSAREYLEAALSPTAGSSDAIHAKNDIRSSIKALFPDRDCFTLVRPAADEELLHHLDEVEPHLLRAQFVEGVSRLTDLVFSRAAPKRIGAQIITGPMLAGLAEAYVTAINAGAVPTIATAWQGVADSECRRAAAAAEEVYRREFDAEGVAPEAEALAEEHRRALAEAKRVFKVGAVGDQRVRAHHKTAFLAATQRHHELHRDRVLAKAQAASEGMLADMAGRLSTAARLKATWPEVLSEFNTAISHYAAAAGGPTKWPRLVAFLQQQYANATSEWLARETAKTAAQLQEARAASGEAVQRAREAEARATRAEARMNDLVAAESSLRRQIMRERQEKYGCLGGCLGGNAAADL